MKPKLLSIKELAAYIRVSTDTIRRAVRKGEIQSTRVRTALRFDLQEVHTYYAAERKGQVWGTLDPRAGRHCRPRAGRPAPAW